MFPMPRNKVDRAKWEGCSHSEKEWWDRWRERVDLNLIRQQLIERAARIRETIDPFFPSDTRKILQIGPAANGEIHFLSGVRFAIDPLASYFKENFSSLMDPEVEFTQGMAEELPYPDSHFDIVLILNVLDHCWNPRQVLREITRCLHQGGLLLLPVNLYNRTASVLHSVFNFLDREHPHALTHSFITCHLLKEYHILQETFYPLDLPHHDRRKTAVLSLIRMFHLAPVGYRGLFRKNVRTDS
jgi:SAM-dependent methyltransferase